VRTHLINAKTLLVYQRQLNNLHLQENRLRRHREKDTAALLELQDNRKQQATGEASSGGNAQLDTAASLYIHAVRTQCQEFFNPAEFGFEFSLREIESRAKRILARMPASVRGSVRTGYNDGIAVRVLQPALPVIRSTVTIRRISMAR
jgi:hypothetical protein